MDEEGRNRPTKAKISSSKSQNSGGQQATFPSTPSTRSNVYSNGFEEAKRLPGKSPTSTSFSEKIRSSLPNIGHHLRRLMKFKSQREVTNEREATNVAMSSMNTSNSPKIAETTEVEDEEQTTPCSSKSHEFRDSPSNLIEEIHSVPAIASTSSADSPSLYDSRTSENSMESNVTTSSIFVQPSIPANFMISSGVATSMDDLSEQMTLASVMTDEGAIIAGDPLDFAAAMNAQLGYDRIRTYAELQARRDQEPRSIPLLFFQDEARPESYMGSSVSGEHGSSTSGSDDSIENSASEVRDDSTETSVSGRRPQNRRDEAQQYYDAALRAAARKRFRHLDDEPPIY